MFVCERCGREFRPTNNLPVRCACPGYRPDGRSEQWPTWANAIKRLSKPQDAGVGDTAQRIAAWMGGELFKAFAEKLGMPCGCTGRQAEWNRLYPYD